jgi:hypothetical protein
MLDLSGVSGLVNGVGSLLGTPGRLLGGVGFGG